MANVYPSVLGCDSTVTTTIVVNPLVTFDESVTICDGETATVNGTDYTTAQVVANVYPSVLGCDSTVTTTIVVNPLVTFDESVTICDGETATVNGTDYTTAQVVANVYPSVLGCDSTVTTTIVVNPLVTFDESVTICDGETATVNGTDYTTAQVVANVYPSVLGCDSTVTTTIVVNPLVTFDESVTICDGETATVNGTDYTTAQVVANVYPSVLGCDSTVTTTIVVNPLVTFDESVTICDGETATVNGTDYTTAQVVANVYPSVLGCDSTVTTTIVVNPLVTFDESVTICDGETATVNGTDYTTAQVVANVYPSVLGCDSTVTTTIVVNPLVTFDESVTICDGETATVNGTDYTTAQVVANVYPSVLGCDSTVTTTIVVNPLVTFDESVTICDGETATVNGTDYTTAQVVANVYPSVLGCDSTVTTTIVVNPLVTFDESVTICDGETATVNGTDYTTAQVVANVYPSVLGCDSTVTTTIVVNPLVTFDESVTICDGETATVNGTDYTTAQVVANVYPSVLGCDSTVTTTIVVNPLVTFDESVTICDGETATVNGTDYTTAQVVANVYPSVLGCDSTVTTTIVVNPLVTFDESVTICDGETATVNGTDYTTAQVVANVYPSVLGCDSTVTTTIVVNPLVTFDESVTICDGETATVNGTDYTTAQVVANVYPSVLGCDSTVTTTIVVNPLVTFDESVTICDGETATVNGTDYTTAQVVANVYPSVLGCDSTVTTTIVVNPLVTFDESVTICDGETATVNGTDYTTAQVVANVYPSVLGCDSTVTTTIVVNPLVTFDESVTICDGETATVNGTDYTTAQVVANVYPSVLGCDSTVTTTIVVNPLVTFDESVTICDGETATVNGTDYTTAQVVANVYPSVLGCDSTVTTTIVVNPLVTFDESVTICDGETATVNGTDYTTAQVVANVYPSVLGCDSTVTTTIVVNPLVTFDESVTICDGETATVNGTDYTTAQVVANVYPSVLGCDSTVTTTIVVNPLVTFDESVTICDGETATVNGTDYTTAQVVANVYPSVLGCDSTVTTTIVVNPLVTFDESVTICDGETATVNGTDYTTAQVVANVYPSVLGCDSTVTTTIVVNPLVTFDESVTICDGETATVNGTDYTTAQVVANVYPSVLGCDSTVTTTIVVNPLVTFDESVTICDGETATVNGTDYTTAQVVANVYPSVLGCDSTVTTTIVVNPLVTFDESVTICDGETATVNGTDYTTAQVVANVYPSVLGCDSTVTTTIVVNPLVTFDESVTICDGETATVNGTDYTTAQVVANVYPSVLGCDSTVTTTIVVNPLVTFDESVTICDGETATVNGTDYTTAQVVANVYPSVLGCDSTVTTTIVVNPLVTFDESVTICDGETATVNGTDYTTAQVVANVYPSVLGCDSTVTTTIVVNPLVTFDESVTICDGETATVNGTDYTTAQVVANVYPSVLGCDSTVTTTIVVNPLVTFNESVTICDGETATVNGTDLHYGSGVVAECLSFCSWYVILQ